MRNIICFGAGAMRWRCGNGNASNEKHNEPLRLLQTQANMKLVQYKCTQTAPLTNGAKMNFRRANGNTQNLILFTIFSLFYTLRRAHAGLSPGTIGWMRQSVVEQTMMIWNCTRIEARKRDEIMTQKKNEKEKSDENQKGEQSQAVSMRLIAFCKCILCLRCTLRDRRICSLCSELPFMRPEWWMNNSPYNSTSTRRINVCVCRNTEKIQIKQIRRHETIIIWINVYEHWASATV